MTDVDAMVERHAAVLKDYVRDGDMETARLVSRQALRAALDSDDPGVIYLMKRAIDYSELEQGVDMHETYAVNSIDALRSALAQGGHDAG